MQSSETGDIGDFQFFNGGSFPHGVFLGFPREGIAHLRLGDWLRPRERSIVRYLLCKTFTMLKLITEWTFLSFLILFYYVFLFFLYSMKTFFVIYSAKFLYLS